MVKETSIHFSLEDVVTIRLHCGNCPNEIVLHPGEQCMAMPDRCANCGASWIQGNKQTDRTRQLIYLPSPPLHEPIPAILVTTGSFASTLPIAGTARIQDM